MFIRTDSCIIRKMISSCIFGVALLLIFTLLKQAFPRAVKMQQPKKMAPSKGSVLAALYTAAKVNSSQMLVSQLANKWQQLISMIWLVTKQCKNIVPVNT